MSSTESSDGFNPQPGDKFILVTLRKKTGDNEPGLKEHSRLIKQYLRKMGAIVLATLDFIRPDGTQLTKSERKARLKLLGAFLDEHNQVPRVLMFGDNARKGFSLLPKEGRFEP